MSRQQGGGRSRRILRSAGIVLGALVLLGVAGWAILSRPRPKGTAGDAAETLARSLMQSVGVDAWRKTGAVRFTFLSHTHLWDRRRNFDQLMSGSRRTLLRINDRTGRVWEDGAEVTAPRRDKLLQEAYAAWVNDSFWLNPVVKIHDPGTSRSIVFDSKGKSQLLVEYSSGGVTPGDAYLWIPGRFGEPPAAWRMWVHVIPIGGLKASWENWIRLSTGARVSTLHRIGPFHLELRDVEGAATLSGLLRSEEDPFAPLLNP